MNLWLKLLLLHRQYSRVKVGVKMLDYDHGYNDWGCPGSDEVFTFSKAYIAKVGIPTCVVCGVKLERL